MGYYCNLCKDDITPEEFAFSISHFGKPLCRTHQSEEKRKSPHTSKQTQRIHPSPNPTPEARKICAWLVKFGWKAELEKWDGFKHIDIAVVDAKVNIEIDGKQHNFDKEQALRDLKRTYHSFKKGYVTLRIPNSLVRDDPTIEETARYIHAFLKRSLEQLDEDEEYY